MPQFTATILDMKGQRWISTVAFFSCLPTSRESQRLDGALLALLLRLDLFGR